MPLVWGGGGIDHRQAGASLPILWREDTRLLNLRNNGLPKLPV